MELVASTRDSQPATHPQLPGLSEWEPAKVVVTKHAYRVDWGPGVRPRFHYVSKRKACQCSLGQACPSVLRVREYLNAGGERAADSPDDYWPLVPEACPICGHPCRAHPRLNFETHGLGWACQSGGTLHYWQSRLQPILRAQRESIGRAHWVIPPVVSTSGETVYAGVTLEDVRAAHEQAQETQRRWSAEGYCPWA
ncbi:MAG: hypothetical protein IT317_24710 [Anaerolineales bacterium]|nr:hypothetical protein [Anaerolineales bacterium]